MDEKKRIGKIQVTYELLAAALKLPADAKIYSVKPDGHGVFKMYIESPEIPESPDNPPTPIDIKIIHEQIDCHIEAYGCSGGKP